MNDLKRLQSAGDSEQTDESAVQRRCIAAMTLGRREQRQRSMMRLVVNLQSVVAADIES